MVYMAVIQPAIHCPYFQNPSSVLYCINPKALVSGSSIATSASYIINPSNIPYGGASGSRCYTKTKTSKREVLPGIKKVET